MSNLLKPKKTRNLVSFSNGQLVMRRSQIHRTDLRLWTGFEIQSTMLLSDPAMFTMVFRERIKYSVYSDGM